VSQIKFGAVGRFCSQPTDMGGAPPALLWAADHPEEIAGLLYIEAPVMVQSVLEKILTYTPEAMADGSMWWWILPLAPGRSREVYWSARNAISSTGSFGEGSGPPRGDSAGDG